ncbi:androgen-dependent TFPI-regulating protein [Nilaparvata lugens]|uniref:androgen-dependent TFPI-regulating protein n=1 Tax=Nilaparvata lugens TaxID=108931 RepID=UPI00193E4012|nr:androgen-dependent TFPI-regulating protein [Nilaparvata lugens]
MFRKLCHCIIMIYYLFFVYFGLRLLFFYDVENVSDIFKKTVVDKNPFMYFSLWGVTFQLVYFTFVIILDYTDITSEKSRSPWKNCLETFRKHFFMAIVFPTTLLIGLTFWTFFIYDRELIYPEVLDREVPFVLNHCCHTIPPILVFIHLFLADQSDINSTVCIVLISIMELLYTVCFIWSGIMYGNWIYLMYDTMRADKIASIFVICYITTCLSFVFGRKLSTTLSRINYEVKIGKRKIN